KRDLSAEMLTQHVARLLGIGRSDVGVAGLKDRRAVTRQYISVPASCEDRIAAVESPLVRVLHSARHGNKLKTGHLRGNRFDVLIREACADAPSRAAAIAEIIRRSGFPNYYGDQRFGHDNETLAWGLDLLTGRKSEWDIPRSRRRFLLRLSLSAVQSAIFNEVLSRRITDGLLESVLPGDVMQVRASGGPFVVEDVPREQERFERGETVISGPMYGLKMRHPTGKAAERELAALATFGLTPGSFAARRKLLPGTRRPLLAIAQGLQVQADKQGLRCGFDLARGVYATVLLREFMKNEPATEELPEETGEPD
ncbi:MAG: tRNA pseudouridine(13) synthase TruD, partial [Planctomycetaceae bacterium]